MKQFTTSVTETLEKNSIIYEVKLHQSPAYTSEDAARERGVRISQIIKTMFLVSSSQEYLVVLLAGHTRLDKKKLQKLTGLKNLEFVTRDLILTLTGFEVGAMSPIGMTHNYPIYMDKTCLEEEIVDISSGKHDAGIELQLADLIKLLQPKIVEISG